MKQQKIKIGPELRARMEKLSDLYGVSLAGIASRALRSFSRHCGGVEIVGGSKRNKKESATPRSSTVLTVRTNMTAAQVRAVVDWYILPYEENPPPMPVGVSQEALAEELKINRMKTALASRI